MNNSDIQQCIDDCNDELNKIFHLIEGHGRTSSIVPFLTKYAIVKTCGTIEYIFKTIISDLSLEYSPQTQNYIDKTIRYSSMNPSKENICNTLKKFDEEWNQTFKRKLKDHEHSNRLNDSIKSLNEARNGFAHGGSPTSSFEDIKRYFEDCIIIMNMLHEVVND